MKNNGFNQQWKLTAQQFQQQHCPLDNNTLNRAVRHATWNDAPTPQPISTHSQPTTTWRWIAAACLVAIILPVWLLSKNNNTPHIAHVNGETFYFECNNHCSAASTIEHLNTLIQ